MIQLSFTRRADLAAGLALAILPAVLYPLAALRRGVFYVGDIFRLYYPQRAVYAAALRQGRLPLWTPDVFAGYPLFAEGETGALYPLNLLLYRFLPIDLALNYSILLSLSLAGVGMYALARLLRMRPAAACLAGLTFACSGFFVGHFNHLNIIAAAPWLPVELALIELMARTPRPAGRHAPLVAALALVVGVQFLAGHPQIWLMSVLTLLGFGLFRAVWPAGGGRQPVHSAARALAPVLGGIGAGLAVAAVQLLPTWELVQQSVRAGGLSTDFFTSFSWHPALLATLLVPFVLGNPYPKISVELAAYLGLLPLQLALLGLLLRRDRLAAFLVVLAGLSLVLAFGDYTPLYAPLAQVPVLNLFRVPARFLYPFTVAVALLASRGLDALLGRCGTTSRNPSPGVALVGGGGIVSAATLRAASLDTLLALRWLLPALTLLLTAGLLTLAWRRRIDRRTLAWAALGLTLVDLYAFAAVYRLTYNDLMPIDTFYERPASLDFFPPQTDAYRTLTHQAIVPALSVARASLYPNTSLLHRIPSAGGYFPLTPAGHARYLASLTPGRLNLLNVRYFVIPQLLPVDAETEGYDLRNPFTPDLVGRSVEIPPTEAEAVEVVSFTSQSAGWPQGEAVAEIVLTSSGGATATLPLRAGIETAEWAYERPDVAENIAHLRPTLDRSWPARSGFPPEDHLGQVYRARFQLPTPMEVVRVTVSPRKPAGLFHIEELTLVGETGSRTVAELVGLARHRLVYRDPGVAVYDNPDALPRAFFVPGARIVPGDTVALAIIDRADFDPLAEVILAAGTGGPAPDARTTPDAGPTAPSDARTRITHYSAHRVEIETEPDRPGYLVLLDSYYPGWRATVDGQPATIHRANVLFRAVAVSPGRHTVTFVYDPPGFKLGGVISLAGLLLLVLWPAARRRSSREAGRTPEPTPNI